MNFELDRKKPRRNLSILTKNLITKECFNEYLKEHPNSKLTYNNFKKVMKVMNEEIIHTIAYYKDGYELPLLGYFIVLSCETSFKDEKNKGRFIDFGASLKNKKLIKHLNYDTDMRMPKIFFTMYPMKYKFIYRQFWKFEPSRGFKKLVSNSFRENHRKFVEISKYEKPSSFYLKK